MKILQVVSSFPPAYSYGGVLKVAYEISNKLIEKENEVTVYTTDVYDSKSRFIYKKNPIKMNGIKVYHFRNISNRLAYMNIQIAPEMIPFLDKNIKNFDIIHLHEYRSFQAMLVHYYAKKYNIPYILQPHGSTPRITKKILKWLYDLIFGYKILKDANKIIAISREEAEYDKQMGANNKKISVIYNGMDLRSFKNLPRLGQFKKKYGINGKIILYLGRIHKLKGIDFLIRAFSKLLEELDDAILVIAGPDNRYKAELQKLIERLNLQDKVKFTGFLKESNKISAYVDADLFVHTVRYMGGVALTPLEAILCGTPVIVTKECGEIIKKANCGCFVKYGDIEGLKEKMKYLLENPKKGKEMVKRGQKYIKKNLSWNKAGRKVEEVYESCICNI